MFSRISARLNVMSCLTIENFVEEIQLSYNPRPTMTLLKRSLNFHEWLDGSMSKYFSSISLPRQFIFSKDDNEGSTVDGVHAMVRCSEWSNSILGEAMFPLQRLPNKKPKWNANRRVFSKWEKNGSQLTRTSLEKAEDIFKKAEAQIFHRNGEDYFMHFDFQRESWNRLLKKIRKWETLKEEEYEGWWPITHEDVPIWLATLPQLPLTPQGELFPNHCYEYIH